MWAGELQGEQELAYLSCQSSKPIEIEKHVKIELTFEFMEVLRLYQTTAMWGLYFGCDSNKMSCERFPRKPEMLMSLSNYLITVLNLTFSMPFSLSHGYILKYLQIK